jgi:hypothetical protein
LAGTQNCYEGLDDGSTSCHFRSLVGNNMRKVIREKS